MKKIIWIVLVVIVLLGLKLLFFPGKSRAGGQGNSQKGGVAGVETYVVHTSDFSYDLLAGASLLAREEVELSTEIGGRISKILFKEGASVPKGALLLKLKDDDLQAQLKKQELSWRLANQRLDRLGKLLAVKGASQEEYDILENEVAVLEADIQYSKAQIAKTEIRAPFSGVLGLKRISEGAVIQNSTPVISLVQQEPLLLDFSIPERYASQINKNMPVHFNTESTSELYSATIIAIEPMVESGTRTLGVRAEFDNKNHVLYPGMSAKIRLSLKLNPTALMVPSQAVIPMFKGKKVFLLKDGKAREVNIETGERLADKVEVTKGLNEGDTLITSGIMSLREGMPVSVIQSKK